MFEVVIKFSLSKKVPLRGGLLKESWDAFVIPIEIQCNNRVGFGAAIFWYPSESEELKTLVSPTTIKRIFNSTERPSSDKPLVSFADKEAQSVLVAGGKGASIGILHSIQESKLFKQVSSHPEFDVPPGFIVSVAVFDRHLKENPKISARLLELEEITYERVEGDMQAACEKYLSQFCDLV